MKESDVRARAFAMPLTSPAFQPGPYRFRQREYLVIAYRTDPEKLRALVPEPLQVDEPVVKYELIRMPDSTGFGDYTETGQVRMLRHVTVDDAGPVLNPVLNPVVNTARPWVSPDRRRGTTTSARSAWP